MTLCIVSLATMVSALSSNIQNRSSCCFPHEQFFWHRLTASNCLIQEDLQATSSQISWTLAAFQLIQGNFPLLWSATSEIIGRKVGLGVPFLICSMKRGSHLSQPVYLLASAIFVVGSAALALSKSIEVMIGMRALQAAGWASIQSVLSRIDSSS